MSKEKKKINKSRELDNNEKKAGNGRTTGEGKTKRDVSSIMSETSMSKDGGPGKTRQRKWTETGNYEQGRQMHGEKSNRNKKENQHRKNRRRNKNKKVWRIATWNVRTMLEVGKEIEVAKELGKSKIEIAALQETRWSKQGQINNDKFTILYSGEEKQGQNGVAFIIMGKTRDNIMEYKAIDGRIAYIRLKAKPYNISIINAYAPTEIAEEIEKEIFYEKMEDTIQKIPNFDTTLILGDFNAQVGREDSWREVTGRFTIHDRTNDNGIRLCNFASRNGLVKASTKFQHRRTKR